MIVYLAVKDKRFPALSGRDRTGRGYGLAWGAVMPLATPHRRHWPRSPVVGKTALGIRRHPGYINAMSTDNTDWLGVDFGTSNSAVAFLDQGQVRQVRWQDDQGADSGTLPTAVFFDHDSRQMAIGWQAGMALRDGADGRFMRSLKRVLGTPLMAEKRAIGGKQRDFFGIIGDFLAALKAAAEAAAGRPFRHVVAGRPVFFHGDDPARDAQAQADLLTCYRQAGFHQVVFVPEPEAAAVTNRQYLSDNALGMVVDIGGGTSDFTVFQVNPEGAAAPGRNRLGGPGGTRGPGGPGGIKMIASHGARIGGTDFDSAINFHAFMPRFGKGEPLSQLFSRETLPAPNTVFLDLATWEKIPFLYSAETLRTVQEYRQRAINKPPFERLYQVLEAQLGHDLARLAEQGKITMNASADLDITLDFTALQKGFQLSLARPLFDRLMQPFQAEITAAMQTTLGQAGYPPEAVSDVVFVGGSSLMDFVSSASTSVFPAATVHRQAIFTSVVDGLALLSASDLAATATATAATAD